MSIVDKNDFNVCSTVDQQNSGDTSANSYGEGSLSDNCGNGCESYSADNVAYNNGQSDIDVEKRIINLKWPSHQKLVRIRWIGLIKEGLLIPSSCLSAEIE